jgi:hypothetical protein
MPVLYSSCLIVSVTEYIPVEQGLKLFTGKNSAKVCNSNRIYSS